MVNQVNDKILMKREGKKKPRAYARIYTRAHRYAHIYTRAAIVYLVLSFTRFANQQVKSLKPVNDGKPSKR